VLICLLLLEVLSLLNELLGIVPGGF